MCGVTSGPRKQIGPYPVLRTLGEGGMATVYLAHDPRHGRSIAIKVMKPAMTEAIGHDRFLREIETIARLSHPHILPLYDSGSADGQLYYVMPYIQGPSLHARLRTLRQLSLDEATRIATGVLSALGHAHQHGLVHRDIKPANILLSDGIALVADFGVARSSARELDANAETTAGIAPLTGLGMIVGTPQYMAPEQAFGDPDMDGRADLYALGCVLYEMLAGEPPFTGPAAQVLRRHAQDPVPPLAHLRSGVPDAVVHVVEKAMAKSAADRFATAAHFIDALTAATAGGAATTMIRPAAQRSGFTIAVLPFQNLGGSPDDTCLADGICDELIHTLGRIDGVRVTARGSSFLFRERTADVRTIGAQLNVGSVIDGTLRRSGKRLRLTAQLINVADGFQVWSERYDREVDDVFALEDDIAGAIAGVLRVKLAGAAHGPATNFEAYERYLMGVHHWNRRTPQDLEKALEHLTAASEIDPAFAPASGAMGLCYVTLVLYGLREPADAMALARASVERALRIDRTDTAALSARACIRSIHDWDAAGSERDFKEVIAASPSDATAHQWYATNLLAPLGRFGEARRALARARELDPLSPSIIVSTGFVSYLAGDLSGAIALMERALSLDPTFSAARYFLGATLMAAGRGAEAVASLEAAAEGMGHSPEVLAALAVVCARSGDPARTASLLQSLVDARSTRYVSFALTSVVRASLGDLDGAFADMARAIDARAVEVIWLEVRPVYAPLRADPRFPALLARREAARRLAPETKIG
jgi:TolB-like protein/Flp pilus assembly protein TadD